MSKLLYLAWNDIRIAFAARSTLVFFLILPLVFTTVIGASLEAPEDQRYAVAVVDADNSDLSARLRAMLEKSETVRPSVLSREVADSRFNSRSEQFVFTIPAGFGAALTAGQPAPLELKHAANDGRLPTVQRALLAAADQVGTSALIANASVGAAEEIQAFESAGQRASYFAASLERAAPLLAAPSVTASYSDAASARVVANGFAQSSPGQLVTWVLITLLGASEVLVNERLQGTLRRLVVTPTSKATIIVGKILGRLGMGLLQIALLIGFGALALGVSWGQSPAALLMVIVSFALAAVAFGMLLGTFAKTRAQAAGLTTLFSMLLAALGGAWWPLEITPQSYQTAVQVLPTTWAMQGFGDVILRGQGASGVVLETGVLLGFATLFFLVGVLRFRFE